MVKRILLNNSRPDVLFLVQSTAKDNILEITYAKYSTGSKYSDKSKYTKKSKYSNKRKYINKSK